MTNSYHFLINTIWNSQCLRNPTHSIKLCTINASDGLTCCECLWVKPCAAKAIALNHWEGTEQEWMILQAVCVYDDLLEVYAGVIFHYSAFKLWESGDNRQLSDRLGVRVTLCISLHLLNFDESLCCRAMSLISRLLHLCSCLSTSVVPLWGASQSLLCTKIHHWPPFLFAVFQITASSLHKVPSSRGDITQQPQQGYSSPLTLFVSPFSPRLTSLPTNSCCAHWWMIPLALGITQHNTGVRASLWGITCAVTRLTFYWETPGCGFSGCAYWKDLFRETFSQWLRIMWLEVWKDTFSHTVFSLIASFRSLMLCLEHVSMGQNNWDWLDY